MNKIPNRQIICDVLIEQAKTNENLLVATSDSRGSASLTQFGEAYPDRHIEVGIAEQDLVGISTGLALEGKMVFAASPACFLSARSLEQIKVDVCYSNANVKLIGISGGISYGALGMTHHSLQDVAVMRAIPNMRIYLPSDRHQTKALIEALVKDELPAYIRVGRNAVEDIYTDGVEELDLDKAVWIKEGKDVSIIATGEMVSVAIKTAELLQEEGISANVIDMFSLKPLDEESIIKASETGLIITLEEHSVYNGLGSAVAQVTAMQNPCRVIVKALPDSVLVAGNSKEVFDYYGLEENKLKALICEALK